MGNVRLSLTKLYLSLNGTRFLRVATVRLPYDHEVEIIIYSSKQDIVLGQTTITGAIAIHESVLDLSYLLHYVVTHEDAHRRQWYSFLSIPFTAIFWLGAPISLLYGLVALGIFIAQREMSYLHMSLQSLLLSIVLLLIACIYSWFIEYKADGEAIRRLGVHTVLNARNYMESLPRPSWIWRVIERMTHPPINFTIRINRFFNSEWSK